MLGTVIAPRSGEAFAFGTSFLVAGGGACGLVAALRARDAGVEVVVLEADRTCHGSSGMSLGAVCAAGTAAQRRHSVEDGAETFFDDIMAKSAGAANRALARLIARQAGAAIDWLAERHDVVFELDLAWKPAFGHTRRRMHTVAGRSGIDMMSRLEAACRRAGVIIVNDARVATVHAAAAGLVRGVTFRRPDGQVERIGCDALLLATSGFGGNPELIARHIPSMRTARYFGWEHNRGEALLWGEALGAATADLSAYQGLGLLAEPHGVDVNPKILIEGGFQVNASGQRFSNELGDVSGQGAVVLAQPGGIAWVIYDERIHAECRGLPQYDGLLALGAMRSGSSAADLAAATGLPVAELTATLGQVAAHGDRPDHFGRVFTTPSLTAPYHALRVTGAIFHTQGGLAVDNEARVVRGNGSQLPNLFAGGGAAQSICGPGPSGYLPGVGLCMALTLGYLAGGGATRLVQQGAKDTSEQQP